MTLGDGKKPTYAALLLFVLGLVAGAVTLFATANRMHYIAPLAAFLVLTSAACFVVAAGEDEDQHKRT